MRIRVISLAIFILIFFNSLYAQIEKEGDYYIQKENRIIDVKGEKELVVGISNGGIHVKTTYENRIKVSIIKKIILDNEKDAVDALKGFVTRYESDGKKIEILSKHKFGFYYIDSYTDFIVEVPQQLDLSLSTKSGNIFIGKLEGDVSVDCEQGNITMDDINGDIHLNIFEGQIDIKDVKGNLFVKTGGGIISAGDVGGFVWIESAGGPVSIGDITGKADITTTAGDIVIGSGAESVKANTAGGRITIGFVKGPVDLETGAGDIEVKGAENFAIVKTHGGNIKLLNIKGFINARTYGGNIYTEIVSEDLNPANSIELKSDSGAIVTYVLPEMKTSVTLTARKGESPVDSNEIYSDFPLAYSSNDRGDKMGRGNLNGGGIFLSIETFDGNIVLKKK